MLSRSPRSLLSRSLVSCKVLNKNVPKFDDAEMLASRLNNAAYTAKRGKDQYKWTERPAKEVEEEYNDRMARMAKISAALRGLLFVAGLGCAYTAYMQWPQIKGWWMTTDMKLNDDAIELLKQRKEKKRLMEFPQVPLTEPPSTTPGLYYWGADRKDGKNSKFPLRVSHFDGQKLRSVSLSSTSGKLAIDAAGDLYRWDTNSKSLILPNQDLMDVKVSNEVAYTLNKRGEILVVPLTDSAERSKFLKVKRSWLLPWKTYCQYNRKLDTKQAFSSRGENRISQFDVGKDHLVFISNAGKAYTCATGTKHTEGVKSKGQFGVPTLSQFDPFPERNKIYEIELLNRSVGESGSVAKRIEKVACGNFHTLALDSLGEVFSFGLNTYGQLGQPISYDMEYVPFPKQVGRFNAHFSRDTYLKSVDIHAGGDTSFVSIVPQDIHKYFRNKGNVSLRDDLDKITYFAFGSGIHGELGNGHYKHSQQDPTKLKLVNDVTGDGSTITERRAKIESWSCGNEHTFCKLENNEVVAWGDNSEGQLGNGKKIKTCKPINIPKLLEPGSSSKSMSEQSPSFSDTLTLTPEQAIVAGEKSSCLYWKI
ncbi:LANO_0D10814g1_1 [Lachancea nothofagi CBS 11611]|uniref:LANO_0D10814g1_1 n=1 Tax=Lachancea nothofagi CBS 11611 TaxID=1266666 RepID=A0A1G4JKL5_9SACH|nr:LANO_0D10814g1_1 [Lachancea nothofagi CBS 11611]